LPEDFLKNLENPVKGSKILNLLYLLPIVPKGIVGHRFAKANRSAPIKQQPATPLIKVAIAAGHHLFPFRTEKLSPPAPMVLRKSGRVGRCRIYPKPMFLGAWAFLFIFASE
jgi:hypothetical protein